MITKTINIGGVEETFRCTGRTPRVYRNLLDRDLLLDIKTFSDAQNEADETQEDISAEALDTFLDIAYVMAYHAAMAEERLAGFPSTVDAWLEKFSMFDLYNAIADIYDLWTSSNQTKVQEKNA